MIKPLFSTILHLSIFLFLQPCFANDDNRAYIEHTLKNGTLDIECTDGRISLTLYSENALEAVFTPRDSESNPPSYAIGTKPATVAAELSDSDDQLILQTDGLTVKVTKTPFHLSYHYQNRVLLKEETGYVDFGADKGFRFSIDGDELFYGAGSRALGRMNRRGERFELYNRSSYGYEHEAHSMYYSMPAVISSKKYMLVFDNAARGHVDLDSSGDGTLQFDAVGGRMAYLIIVGATWPDLSKNIADITGHQPMLPRWALGSIASRMGYHSQEEVETVVDAYINDRIPLDAIVLDLFWFGESIFGSMGNLDWDRKVFPEPIQMIEKIKGQGVKTILITEPLMLTASKNWDDAVAHNILATDADGKPQTFDAFFGEAALIDMFNPSTHEWFWNFYKRHTDSGVAGWWGDLGEPETHPDDIRHFNGLGEELHNAFGHEWARLVYEGYRRDFPAQRPFILMRSGFVGTQRYGILPWSGDVNRTWGGFKPQVELSLQMGLQGVAYMHSDLGGFAGNNREPELYVRWLQYGTFQPIYRPHGHEEVPPEPIYWDEDTKNIVRRYIELRYRLLPYNYTLMFENAIKGMPLMRPLMFVDDRAEMKDNLDAYLWGDALLIAPITEPGITERSIPLPQGTAWFDLWTGKRYAGGQTVTVPVTLENIPVFVKAGAFIPTIEPIQNTEQYDPSVLRVHYYADASVSESAGQVYDDDGHTSGAFERKQYELLRFRSENHDGRLMLHLEGEQYTYSGMPDSRSIRYIIHSLGGKPNAVRVDGENVDIRNQNNRDAESSAVWSETASLLIVTVQWDGTPRTVFIDISANTEPEIKPDVTIKLDLNDGKKWKVHDHMNKIIVDMASLSKEFPAITSTNDARVLADKMQKQIGELVSNCTMSGAAHDQLHIFLTSLFPIVEKLENQNDVSDLKKTKRNVDELFVIYGEYFE